MLELEQEKPIGKIWHYHSHAHVGIIELTDGEIDLGNMIRIKGAHLDFRQPVESLQLDYQNIAHADKGKRAGVQLKEKIRENDKVYLESVFVIGPDKKVMAMIVYPMSTFFCRVIGELIMISRTLGSAL